MKELKLKITHQNWSLMGMGDWNNTEWKIYNDLSVEIKVEYNPMEIEELDKEIVVKKNISIQNYNEILRQINLSKEDNTFVGGCDGDAWEILQYNDNVQVWKRELGYIYGIKPLEKIAKILEKMIEV